jgi:O-antigen ligase
VSDLRALLFAAPSAIAFLLVNHRSAYLAIVMAVGLYALLTALTRNWTTPPLWRFLALGGIATFLVLLLTPIGQEGFARLASITNTEDPNIAGRVELSRRATELHGSQWIDGAGVGEFSTSLDPQDDEESTHSGFHNSFLSALHTGGLIGFLVILAPIVICVVQMLRRNRDVLVRAILSVTVFSCIMAATNVFLENSYGSVWVWFPIIAGWRLAVDVLRSPGADEPAGP